jgi:hypothetical protein
MDKVKVLDLEEAIRSEEDHKNDLTRLYQIFFGTHDFYVSSHALISHAYHTDPLWSQMAVTIPPSPADTAHRNLILHSKSTRTVH